ncbi:TetR/AcrR family transcriptional regulator C-terminal domain-containing protein [Streptomyces sp. MST-110588]|uniref:TetR/AcrR family transcriptional regulator C-terminal domain-containing protein n=1 Tax=Streptomyces sp. MST-110588 TaxID=2833628 RepID=UPI001F5DED2A|nr:TetR/AcrR family transcriptional regulator C-terminal domain-containing protein [Streptomyces sp. MST-110588]UNO40259.1 TetR/AcrR family transcriptional regulator C-terminal domain-containing protein [Streptomyces sp. MST-110588]
MATRLNRAQVVETALRLLNEVGPEGLTLRRIAKELNVQAPALYWHFKNKQELQDEMATQMYRQMTGPFLGRSGSFGEGDWEQGLLTACRLIRHTLLGYREGAKVFGGTRLARDASHEPLERLLESMVAAGFTLRQAARTWAVAYDYTIGFVVEEQSVYPVPGERDPAYDQGDRERRIGAEFPLSVAAGEILFDGFDEGFEEGLRIVLAGARAVLRPGG